jgi:hypothetical protein
MTRFEDNLWAELEREHAPVLLQTLAARRRARAGVWVGVAAGVAVLGAAAVIAPVYFGGTPPAYAVAGNPDGSVTVTVRDAERFEDATAALREHGVPAVAVVLSETCPEGEARKIEYALTSGSGPVTIADPLNTEVFEARITPDQLPVGVTLVLAAKDTGNGFSVVTAYARGDVPKCVLQPSPRQPVPSIPQPTPTY